MTLIKMNPNKLFYYKCLDCLTPVAVDTQDSSDIVCDCGGDHLTFMGQVVGSNYMKTVEKCKCNEICSYASGPCCSCHCGGVNHGLKMLANITVNEITGKVEKRIKCKEASRDHAEWYRSIVKKCEDDSIYGDLNKAREDMKKGIRADWPVYTAIYRVAALKSEFRNAKTVKKRESVYAKILTFTTKSEVQNGIENTVSQSA